MYYLLFLIHPFTMLFMALKNLNGLRLANVIWLFTVFYSATIGIEAGSGSDILVYMDQVRELYGVPFDIGTAWSYYNASGEIDVLRIFLAILVSRFTENGFLLAIVYGVIFGYFFSRNLSYILSRLEGSLGLITVLLLLVFVLLNPIWNLNGFRFWTATHVFIYGLLPFLFEGNKRSLLWCVVTPFLFHFSYLLPLGILGIYLALGNRLVLFYGFFIVSVFVSEINYEGINQAIKTYAPVKFAERTAGYRTVEAIKNYREGEKNISWHARYYKRGLIWALILYLLVLYWKSSVMVRKNDILLKLMSITLLFFGVANIVALLPSGGRFTTLASMLAVVLLAYYLQNNPREKVMTRLIPLTYPLLALFIMVAARDGLYQMSITTVIGNPLLAVFTLGENVPLNTFLE